MREDWRLLVSLLHGQLCELWREQGVTLAAGDGFLVLVIDASIPARRFPGGSTEPSREPEDRPSILRLPEIPVLNVLGRAPHSISLGVGLTP